jgi:protein-L-isoaspartate(D-aspartate) O-methyltransferase
MNDLSISGHASHSLDERIQMIRTQISARGIMEPRLLAAISKVPREAFVPKEERHQAYRDCALPIGHGQTISQPFTVAMMIDALQPKETDIVLEIGTGSGYSAAVLSLLAKEVHTIERIEPLAREAQERLTQLGYANVHVHVGDGTLGLPEYAPYDGIVVTAGGNSLPQPYVDQLADGGRIVIPLGERRSHQSMFRYTRHGEKLEKENLGGFLFVPLIGQYGWNIPNS